VGNQECHHEGERKQPFFVNVLKNNRGGFMKTRGVHGKINPREEGGAKSGG